MNTQQIVDSIRQVFPEVSRNQIRLDVDIAQKLLADETGSITTRGSLSAPTSNFAWSLPTGFLKLKDFVMYDADNNPIYAEERNYKYEVELSKFFVYSITSTPITGLDCTTAYIHYEALPTTLTTESTAMQITEHYRDAIEHYVLSKYFSKFPIPYVAGGQVVKALNFQAASFHMNEYEKQRIKIKRLFNSRETTDNEYINYSYPGKFYLPRRPNDSSSGSTISVPGLTDLYTKYAYFKITSVMDASITPTVTVNYATIACTYTGDTITLSSTADFDEETIILINNWDSSWVRNSSSEIVITAPTGWTTIAFEIYERD